MAPDEVKPDEIFQAVETAQGPIKDPSDEWQHLTLKEAATPYDEQIDAWLAEGRLMIRSVDYSDVKAIRLDDSAMQKLFEAWFALHPYSIMAVMDLQVGLPPTLDLAD